MLLARARHEIELSTDLLVRLSKSTCISVDQHAIALVSSHLIFGTKEVSVSWLGNFLEPLIKGLKLHLRDRLKRLFTLDSKKPDKMTSTVTQAVDGWENA